MVIFGLDGLSDPIHNAGDLEWFGHYRVARLPRSEPGLVVARHVVGAVRIDDLRGIELLAPLAPGALTQGRHRAMVAKPDSVLSHEFQRSEVFRERPRRSAS